MRLGHLFLQLSYCEKNVKGFFLKTAFLLAGFFAMNIQAKAQSVITPFSISTLTSAMPNQVTEMAIDQSTGDIYSTGTDFTNGNMYKTTTAAVISTISTNFASSVGYWHPYVRTGIAFNGGNLYLFTPNSPTSFVNLAVLRVNATTGVSTVLNATSIGGGEDGCTFIGNVLYMTDGIGAANSIYTYNTVTSTFATLTSGTLPGGSYDALRYCAANNTLYYGNAATGGLYTVNQTTGALTLISSSLASGTAKFVIDPFGVYAYYLDNGNSVNRIKLSTGVSSSFATGLASNNNSDLAFGPSSSGSGLSLYIGGFNRIYEVTMTASFDNGSSQNLTVCKNSSSNSLNALLAATNSIGGTFTWTVTSGPSNGTLFGFPATASAGTSISPSGTSYTPTSGFTGSDAFTIQVSDGTNSATTTINVTVSPAPITGTLTVCEGATTTLSDATPGGTWSSAAAGTASVGAGTGIVTGVTAGTATISYTVAGCSNTTIVTVNATPTPITGIAGTCIGSTTNLVASMGGGTWTSSATGVATIGSATGTVTGVTAGSSNITYAFSTGCFAARTVTVAALPGSAPYTVTPNPYCLGTSTTFASTAPLCSGNMLLFNGSTSQASLGAPLTTAQDNITMEAWVSWTGGTANYQFITLNGHSATTGYGLIVPPGGSGNLQILISGITYLTSSANLPIGTWTHVAAVRNSGTWSVYMNGTQYSVTSATTTPNVPTTAFRVGCSQTGVEAFNGAIDEVKFWSVARSTASIQADMNACNAFPQTNLLGYWKLDESSGTSGFDNSGNGNTLTESTIAHGGSVGLNLSTFAWSFGDGGSSTANNVVYTYTASGTYSSSLVATNEGGCTASSGIAVTVNPNPVISGTQSVCVGFTTTLSSASIGGTWSSASANATVGAGTGIVTGVSAGTANITYTLPTGCFSFVTVTVNGNPAAIGGGPMDVCVGLNTTLTDATAGGSWTSSNTTQATVVSGTGVVTGVSAGTPYITYTLPTGCYATQQITVNPNPAAITGTTSICVGFTSTLADATAGGSWSSGAPGTASVGAGTGIVTAIAVGTATITYTLPTGCINTTVVTVDPNPAAIGGTTNVCEGLTTTLTNGTSGGTWTSSDISKATIGSATGTVTGVAAGTLTITYMLPTGCYATTPFTVNTTPVAITGIATVCVGSTTTLSNGTSGGTWSSGTPGIATVGAGTGMVTGVTAGTVTITYLLSTGCLNTRVVTVNGNPAAIGGTFNVCEGLTTTLTDATSGGTWTSSNPTSASIGASSGIVTGIAAGTVNITYQLPTGCLATTPFTVNPTPAAISGASSVCEASTITLTNASTGGTWSSSSANATVVAATGVVTGVTAGTATITYTLPAGCIAVKSITINPTPAAIGGANTVCVGLTTTLTDATSGGVWTSSNPGQATIGSASGVVTGIASGTPTMTYTLPAGCYAVLPFTVNPTPAAISGASTVCANSTITLTDITGGGTWSSSNTGLATVGSSSGVVTGVAAGTPTITYTLAAGCTATKQITVNAVPDITNFTSPTSLNPCLGNGLTVNVNSNTLGSATFTVTYNLSGANSSTANTATLTMGATTGTFTIPSSLLTSTGSTTVTITGITNALGCTSYPSSSNTATFSVNPLPTAYTVSGTGSYCSGGAGIHVFLSNSVGGVSYQLYYNGSPTGSPVAGAFAALDMGAQTLAGTYTIVATNTTTTCTNNMTGSAIISINPLPTAFAVTGGGSYCAGGTGVTIGLASSQSGVSYQLWLSGSPSGSAISGTGGAISFAASTSAGTYNVVATNTTTLCTNNMTGTATVTVNPVPAGITGTQSVCAGLTTTLASSTSGGTWTSVNTAVATVNSTSGVVTGVAAGTSVISYTLPTGCATVATVTVNALPSAIAGAGTVCVASTMALTDPTGGGTWTSSNVGEATIGSSSGIVTGVAAGTPTITYTLPTGCIATAQITVNATPAAIGGTPVVCVGASTLLTNTLSGGTWTSSSATFATVGSGTGILTGVSAGNPVITYTVAGCTATVVATVNPNPASIVGTPNVCETLTRTLTDATTGGVWSSSNTGLATVGSTTGVVTGVAAGTLNISYTLATGCFSLLPFTVNPTPAAITGLPSVCVGLTTTINDITSGGTWTSSNTTVATIGSNTGIVSGLVAGPVTLTYTLPAGCFTTFVMTVNPNPAAIAGASSVCLGFTTTLTDATTGGTWSSSNTSVATISGGGVLTGAGVGTATITYTLPTGCIATKLITVNANPAAISGASTVCVGSNTLFANATSGGTWSSNNTLWATVGSVSGIVTGVGSGVPTISYILSTGCYATAPITVNPVPAAVTGPSTMCTGQTTTLTDATSGGAWSSSDLVVATVGSSTGLVNALTAGTVVMSYTLPTGCFSTLAMTVNVQPAVITGASSVCNGFSTTLGNATSGGTWTSSNATIASIGSGTGVVNGLATGAVTITYTMPGGCASLWPFTVNPMPASIAGSTAVCVGSSITLTDATTGGTWTSSNIALATVGSASGVVTGVSAGVPTITYMLPAGCFVTRAITVNPLPASIGGVPVVCVNATTNLTNATSGGIWSSSNIGVATIGSTTGIVTGITAGNPTFTYTLPTGCFVTIAGTVNPLPLSYSLTGGGAYCAGGSGLTVGLSGSNTGINYQLLLSGSPVGGPTAGTGSALSFGAQTAAGTYTVQATNTTTGCSVLMTGSALIVVNPVPTAFAVSSGGSYCAGGAGVNITLASSQAGVSYQLYIGGVVSGSPVNGTGALISFGPRTAAGVYTVIGTNTLTYCTNVMTGAATIVVNPLPTVYTVTGGGAYCVGGTGVTVGLSNSDVGIDYTLYRGGSPVGPTISGTGAPISFGLQTIVGTYTVFAQNVTTSCNVITTSSVVVTTNSLPNVLTIAGGGSYCAGGTGVPVTLTGTTQVGVNYQLYYAGTALGAPVAGTGASGLSFGLQTSVGTYTAIGTSALTTCTVNMTGSVTVTTNPLPTVYTVGGGGPICAGGPAIPITLSGSDVTANYIALLGGVPVFTVTGTGSALSVTSSTAGTYTVRAQDIGTGCTSMMLGSATISINPLPNLYTVTGTGSYCAGGSGLNVGVNNSELGINYQLYLGASTVGTPVAGTGAAISFGPQTTAGSYTVVATNVATLCTRTMTGSAVISINPLPVVNLITGGGSYCSGAAGVPVGLDGSVSGVKYRLFNGATLVDSLIGNGTALNFGLKTVAGVYTATATNTVTACSSSMSGSATVVINPLPTVYNVSGGGSYCAGGTGLSVGLDNSSVGFTYQVYNGGVASGAPMAGTGFALDFGIRTASGTYTIVATDDMTLCTSTMAGSAVITIDPLPTVYNVTGGGNYCAGGTGVHVGLSNSAVGISYQLMIGGSPVGAPMTGTGAALDFGLYTTAGTYTIEATNSITGCVSNMAGSAAVTVYALPSVYTVTGGGSYCIGGSGVVVDLSGSDVGVTYQLYTGGSPVGAPVAGTTLGISFGAQTIAGSYTVVATDDITGCTSNMASSASVAIDPLPNAYTVTGGGSYCAGGAGVHIILSNSDLGVDYQLMNGTATSGSPMPGVGGPLDFGLQTVAGTYTVVATNGTTTCTNNMTGSANVSINSLPASFTVTGGGSYCAGGTGHSIGLSGSTVGVNYQLYVDGTATGLPVAGTGSLLDFGVHSTPGVYTVVATTVLTGCTDNMLGTASININPLPVVYAVTGGGSYCVGGFGLHVGLAASEVGVAYQLFKGTAMVGSSIGGTGLALDFGVFTASGIYTVVATNTVTGCIQNMGGSVSVTINTLPSVFVVTGGGSYCAGGAGFHIGLSGSSFGVNYQLYNGGTSVGTPMAGTGSAIDFGVITIGGNYTVVATNPSTGCSSNMSGSATITVNPLPLIYTVTGGGNYCPGGSGVYVGLSGSNVGINYRLMRGTTLVATLPGTDSTVDFGLQTVAGTYTVVAVDAASSCTSNMTGSAVVVINTLPAVYTVTGGGGYCAGGVGLHVTLSGSQSGVNYQLYKDGTPVGVLVPGTGLPIDLGVHAYAGTYTIKATNATTLCTANMSGSVIIVINPLPALFTLTGGGSYCSGSTAPDIVLGGSTSGIQYQLFRGSVPVGTPMSGTGSSLNFGPQPTAGSYTVVATNLITGCTMTMTGTIAVAINPLPAAYSVLGGGSYCSGDAGVAVSMTGSDAGITYELFRDGSPTGTIYAGVGGPLSFGLQTIAGVYTVVATNSTTGCVRNMFGGATVAVNSLPALFAVTGGGSYCSGGSGVPVGLSGSALGISYQLRLGGIATGTPVSGTGGAISFGLQTAAGMYDVVATNTTTGCPVMMTGSVSVTINTLPIPYLVIGGGSYCAGGAGISVGLGNSDAGIDYQLFLGSTTVGSPVSGTGSAISFGNQTMAGIYTVVATNVATGCTETMAGTAFVGITPLTVPSVTINTGVGDTVCSGTSVTYTALTTGAGGSPSFQWMVGSTVVGSGSSYTYTPANGDVVTVQLTSSAACATPPTVSDNVTMTVRTNETPVVTISAAPGDTVCQGTVVTYTVASTLYGGTGPVYNWYVNGAPVSLASSSFTYVPVNNDVVFVNMNSNYPCLLTPSASSNQIAMKVETTVAPTVIIAASYGTYIAGVVYNDTFTATVNNGGFHPVYQWSINGVAVPGATTPTLIIANVNNHDAVTCFVVNGSTCGALSGSATEVVNISTVGTQTVTSISGDIRLVPNPNKGTFMLKGTLGPVTDEAVTVEITNMLGQVIYTAPVKNTNGNIDEQIRLDNNVANGMYLVNLRAGGASKVFHMVIEQ